MVRQLVESWIMMQHQAREDLVTTTTTTMSATVVMSLAAVNLLLMMRCILPISLLYGALLIAA